LAYPYSAKEKADVDKMGSPSVKAFFSQQSEYDAKYMKEKVSHQGSSVFKMLSSHVYHLKKRRSHYM
jgi:hypothetical protein